MDQQFISVILPTYNEKNNILVLIEAIHQRLAPWPHEIIVIDDLSPDGTYQAVCALGDRRVKAILRSGRPSLAVSIMTGLRQAAGNIILVMDSDFDHNPQYIPFMVNSLAQYDCVCASRFLPGGRMNGWGHALGSWLFNLLIRMLTRSPLTDHLYGYFMIRKAVLEKCPYEEIFYGHGDYYIRFLYHLQRNKVSILEFPAVNGGRVRPKNLNFLKTLWQYLRTVIHLPSPVSPEFETRY